MLFNTFPFPLFLVAVILLYWIVFKRSVMLQNIYLILVNLTFYGLWNYRWIPILLLNSVACYLAGLSLGWVSSRRTRRILLALCLTISVGTLLLLKYYDFFASSFAGLLGMMGLRVSLPVIRLILPVGISFYTLMILSYPLDVYFKRMEPQKDIVSFLAFSSFFPLILSGPIERARNMMPQFLKKRQFNESLAKDGLRQILWGLLMKVVIADNIAPVVDHIFADYLQMDGLNLVFGILFFTVQIYCDFAGYSYIAIGVASLFGFSVMRNFAFPYLSRDIAEFWRRWHISLSTWFRDYIFMPFCGDRPGKTRKVLGILVTFAVSGLWHGAAWIFVVWGILHGLLFVPRTVHRRIRASSGAVVAQNRSFPGIRDIRAIVFTFSMVSLAWLLFRAPSIPFAISYMGTIFSNPYIPGTDHFGNWPVMIACIGLFVIEWFQRRRKHGMDIAFMPVTARWSIYYLSVLILIFFGDFGGRNFIYAEF